MPGGRGRGAAGHASPTTATSAREIELTSYGEIVLAPPEADRAHPAFGNLFVETEWHDWCTRHHRHPPPALGDGAAALVRARGGRRQGAGRAGDLRDRPGPLPRPRPHHPRPGGAGRPTGRSPAPPARCSTRSSRCAPGCGSSPGQSASVAFTTLVATTPRARLRAGRPLPRSARRAARARPRLDLEPGRAARARAHPGRRRRLPGAGRPPLLRQPGAPRAAGGAAPEPRLAAAALGQRRLGRLADPARHDRLAPKGCPTLRQLLAAHHYWRRRGMMVDLVVLNAHPPSYLQELADRITAAVYAVADAGVDRPAGRRVRPAARPARARRAARCSAPPRGCTSRATAARWAGSWRPRSPDELPERRPRRRCPADPARAGAERLAGVRARCGGSAPASRRCWRPLDRRRVGAPAGARSGRRAATSGADARQRLRRPHRRTATTRSGSRGDQVPPAPWSTSSPTRTAASSSPSAAAGSPGPRTATSSGSRRGTTTRSSDPVERGALPAGRGDRRALVRRRRRRSARTRPTPSATAPGVVDLRARARRHRHAPHPRHGGGRRRSSSSLLRVTNRGRRGRAGSRVTAYVEWTLGVLREHTQHQVRTEFDREQEAILARNSFDPAVRRLDRVPRASASR